MIRLPKTKIRKWNNPIEPLTHGQRRVYNLLIRAMSEVEIAEELFLSVKTIKFHKRDIYKKQNVRTQAQLVMQYYEMMLSNREASA